jgi:tetratricopeptide (TPR) repeat protein
MRLEDKPAEPQYREALVSMTALAFIEEHALLRADQLEDAKNSLQALFLHTSGEETMLRKLIDILKTTKQIHQSFASIFSVLSGITRGVQTVDAKVVAYKQALATMTLSAEENAAFAGPFLSFSQALLQKMGSFDDNMRQYVELRETEARYASIYRIAMDARERLKQRLSGVLGSKTGSEVENRIRQNVVSSFDYSEAESNLQFAQRDAHNKAEEILEQLEDIRAMCQMAKNPSMREKSDDSTSISMTVSSYSVTPTKKKPGPKVEYDDVFTLFSRALRAHPRLLQLKDIVLELFRLYQHSYGMLSLDCSNLNKAIETMFDNSEAYFEAKEEDKDIRSKREKLKMIEGLIPFLEHTAVIVMQDGTLSYGRFSRKISDVISEKRTPWAHIAEFLLRSKVQAEADLSTRL